MPSSNKSRLPAQKSPRKRKYDSGTPLKREEIVSTALALVDRDGLNALSMRRLGAELGVDPMAVYYHIPNKQALLDAIVEAVMAGIDLSVDHPEDPAEERILCAAQAYLDAMLAHANALPIVFSRGPATAAALRPVELLIGVLRDAGLPPAEAFAGMNAIAAAVRGIAGMVAAGPGKRPSRNSRKPWRRAFRQANSRIFMRQCPSRASFPTAASILASGRWRVACLLRQSPVR